MPEPTESLEFIQALEALAARLAADDIVVHAFNFQTLSFGNWEIEVGRRRQRVQVRWDGKDKHLRVSTAQLASGSTARRWDLAEEHDYRGRREGAAQLVGSIEPAIRAHLGL